MTRPHLRDIPVPALPARLAEAGVTNPERAAGVVGLAVHRDGAMSWDDVELSNTRACMGRLYFHVPGGIKYGQHWLNVQFEKTLIRVPFRVFTKEEEKMVSKNYGDIKKQVKAAFAPPKKNKDKDKDKDKSQ